MQFEDGKPNINFERTVRRLPIGAENTEDAIEELLNNRCTKSSRWVTILLELIDEQIKTRGKDQMARQYHRFTKDCDAVAADQEAPCLQL